MFNHLLDGLDDRLAGHLVDDLKDCLDRPIPGVVIRPAGQGFGRGVKEDDVPERVGDDHRVPDAQEVLPKPVALVVDLFR